MAHVDKHKGSYVDEAIFRLDGANILPLADNTYILGKAGMAIKGIVLANGATIGQAAGPLLTFDDTENVLELTGASFIIGHTAILNTSQFEIVKSAAGAYASVMCYSTTDADQSIIYLGKSSSAAIGTNAQTATGEAHGGILWMSPTGAGAWANVAGIEVVQNGAATNRSPMELRVTVSDGTNRVERLRIGPAGWITTLAAAPANVIAAGAAIFGGGVAIGADALNNLIDDASGGTGSTAIYIGNAQITVASDVRIKRNILPTGIKALDALRRLDVIDFTWDDPTDRNPHGKNFRGKWTGITAQNLLDVLPWVVNADGRDCPRCKAGQPCTEHGMMFVELEHMVPVLVKGFQELQEADWLKRQIQASLVDLDFRQWLRGELLPN